MKKTVKKPHSLAYQLVELRELIGFTDAKTIANSAATSGLANDIKEVDRRISGVLYELVAEIKKRLDKLESRPLPDIHPLKQELARLDNRQDGFLNMLRSGNLEEAVTRGRVPIIKTKLYRLRAALNQRGVLISAPTVEDAIAKFKTAYPGEGPDSIDGGQDEVLIP